MKQALRVYGIMNHNGILCNRTADSRFGPAVECHDFDFTLSFEQTSSLSAYLRSFCFYFHFGWVNYMALPLRHMLGPYEE
jgi:hypothetical protein